MFPCNADVKRQSMSLIVMTFPDSSSVDHAVRALKDPSLARELSLLGAAVVSKTEGQNIAMEVVVDHWPSMAATGAAIGALAGLPLGAIAALVMATGGAVVGASAALTARQGASAALTARQEGTAQAQRLVRTLPAETKALAVELDSAKFPLLVTHLEHLGAVVLYSDSEGAS
jgi:uncharacterized membrane protein